MRSREQGVLACQLGLRRPTQLEVPVNDTVEHVVHHNELFGHRPWRIQVGEGDSGVKVPSRKDRGTGIDDLLAQALACRRKGEGVPGQQFVEPEIGLDPPADSPLPRDEH